MKIRKTLFFNDMFKTCVIKSVSSIFALLFLFILTAQGQSQPTNGWVSIGNNNNTGNFYNMRYTDETTIAFSFRNLPRVNSSGLICGPNHRSFIMIYLHYNSGSTEEIQHHVGTTTSGSHSIDVGRKPINRISFQYNSGATNTGCTLRWGSTNSFGITRPALGAPTNLTHQLVNNDNNVRLSWQKGTGLSDANTQYLIRRNGTEITRVAGSVREYTDTGVTPGQTVNYTVQTIVGSGAPGAWARDLSAAVTTGAFQIPFTLTASSDQLGRVRLAWSRISHIGGAEAIVILRDGEEIEANHSKNAINYTDNDVVPGMVYTYQIRLLGTSWQSQEVTGKSRNNGRISGYVRSGSGQGIEGVELTVTSTVPISDNVTNQTYIYNATTEQDGYYELRDVFYGAEASYRIVPKLPGYDTPRFDPDQLTRTLDIEEYNIKNVNFTDTASFTVTGQVHFNIRNDYTNSDLQIGVDGVDIYVDGNPTTITGSDGRFSLNFPQAGNYHIAAGYRHHHIRPLQHGSMTDTLTSGVSPKTNLSGTPVYGYTVPVRNNVSDVNFIDLQTDTLQIDVYATDGKFPIGEEVLVDVRPVKGNGEVFQTRVFPPLPVYANGNKVSVTDDIFGTDDPESPDDLHAPSWIDDDTYLWNGQQVSIISNNPGNTNGTAQLVLPAMAYEVYVTHIIEKNHEGLDYGNGNALVNTNKQEFFRKLKKQVSLSERDTVDVQREVRVLDPPQDEYVVRVNPNYDPDDPDSPYEITDTIPAGSISDDIQTIIEREAGIQELAFVYHADLDILWQDENDWERKNLLVNNKLEQDIINRWGPDRSQHSNKLYLLEQGEYEVMNFEIVEHYSLYDEVYQHRVDSAIVDIYDGIGDFQQVQRYRYVPRDNEKDAYRPFAYQLMPGFPNFSIVPFHEKVFQLFVRVGEGDATLTKSKTIYATVTGMREEEGKGVVSSPNIPYMVLHRPPGDNSYAKLAKGSTFTFKKTNKYGTSGGAGVQIGVGVGGGFIVEKYVKAETTLLFGRDNEGERGYSSTITIEEDISTTQDDTNVGSGGDILFFNTNVFNYGIYNVLEYELPNGEPGQLTPFKSATLADEGVGSIVMYTSNQIKDIEIPKLENLIANNETQLRMEGDKPESSRDSTKINGWTTETNRFREQIRVYEKVLHDLDSVQAIANANDGSLAAFYDEMVQDVLNHSLDSADADNKVKELLKNDNDNLYALQKNITFSNGVDYRFSLENSLSAIDNFNYEVYVDWDISAIVGARVGELNYIQGGAVAKLHSILDSEVLEREGENKSQIEIFMSDDDYGDHFSVNVYVDPKYKTPIFGVYGGASSCPYEPGTLMRDLPYMAVSGNSKVVNVPADQPAIFKLMLGNESVTEEARMYSVTVNPRSNPHGAAVYLGGQRINNATATFYIQPKDSAEITLEVHRGAIAYQYDDIELIMTAECDVPLLYAYDPTQSKVNVTAHFAPSCGEVDLFKPGNNWLVSSLNHDRLQVTFHKYDPNNSNLREIRLQYRSVSGQGAGTVVTDWVDVVALKPEQLVNDFYDFLFDVSNLPDGDYELRATSVCQDGYYYSDVYRGVIDRTNVNVYGLPEPANGILGIGSGISVEFNTQLAASQPRLEVKLVRADNGEEIPVSYEMNAARTHLSIVPQGGDQIFDFLENKQVNAYLIGAIAQNANEQQDTIKWSFIVNRSPVYWDPANVDVTAEENKHGSLSAQLKNKTAQAHNFVITRYPEWLNPTLKTGNIVPFGEFNIDFAISRYLNTGVYQDTVVAMVNGKELYLYVSVSILKEAPDWTVNPDAFAHNMNIVAQFSIDQTDELLSHDTRDKIGVFVGDQPRGYAYIEYEPTQDAYVAYITAYSNDPTQESLNFRFWDAHPGIEYIAQESTQFVSGGMLGAIHTPYILHPEAIVQTIPLERGWNWISLFLENEDMSTAKVLSSTKPSNGDVITPVVNDGQVSEYEQTIGWAGTLQEIELHRAYRIYVHQADTIRWIGHLPEEASLLPLNDGWNALGYTMPYNTELNSYLKDVTFPTGTRIVSQDEFALYDSSTQSWNGSLRYLRPNKGYRIVVEGEASAFPFSTYAQYQAMGNTLRPDMNATVLPRSETTIIGTLDPDKAFDAADFEGSMNTTYAFRYNGEDVNAGNALEKFSQIRNRNSTGGQRASNTLASNIDLTAALDRFEVMAYVDEQLVGISKLQSLSNGQIRGFMSSSIDAAIEGKNVQFVVYDAQQDLHYNAQLSQEVLGTDGNRAGTIGSPIVLTLEGNADIKLSTDLTARTINLKEQLSYEVQLHSDGEDAAVNINLEELIPSGFNIVSAQSLYGEISVEDGRWQYHTISLKKGVTERIMVTLAPNRVGIYPVGAMEAIVDNDIDLSNNTLYAKEIEVIDERSNDAKVFIPAIITPNGDGINDRFEIVGLGQFLKEVNLVIYSKTSAVIYRNSDYQNEWDGGNYPVGSYGYHIKGVNEKGEPVEFTGYVSIVR